MGENENGRPLFSRGAAVSSFQLAPYIAHGVGGLEERAKRIKGKSAELNLKKLLGE